MGYRVTSEVFDRSKAKGGKLLILLAIAETAHNEDGVAFGIDQGWPSKERNERRRRETIAGKARLAPDTVSRLINELAREDELEVRWVQQRRERTAVYRIVLGIYRDLEVDVERLNRYAQHLDKPFSTPEELALPWLRRPANFAGGSVERRPAEMSGRRDGDDLTSGPQLPDNDHGDGPTSVRDDAALYARADRPEAGPDPSLTSEVKNTSEVAAAAAEQPDDLLSNLVRSFAGKLGRWPADRGEWGAWKKAFAPLAELGVAPDELGQACESYLAYHRRLGRSVDLTPFALTKHWQVISQSLERRFFSWMQWASEISWRLPEDEVAWQLERAAKSILDGDHAEVAAVARRARAAHNLVADDVMRWVDAEGWALDDDDWRHELAERLPRAAATELRRQATHRRHELRRDLARLRAGLALPAIESDAA